MAAYITVGAKTTHGGEVITGSPYTTHNGVQVSRKGDKVICKKCKKLTTILTGDPSFIVDGAPIAREGDVTSCGATLIAIQQSFAESDFEVFGVEQPEPLFEQPAPLQFPKTDPDALIDSFINPTNKDKSTALEIKKVSLYKNEFIPLGVPKFGEPESEGLKHSKFTIEIRIKQGSYSKLTVLGGSGLSDVIEERTDTYSEGQTVEIEWDGFINDIYDSRWFTDKNNRPSIKVQGINASGGTDAHTYEIETEFKDEKWADVVIDRSKKRIDVTIRVNIDSHIQVEGISPNARTIAEIQVSPQYVSSKPILRNQTKTNQQLRDLVIAGMNKYWSRNSTTHTLITPNITVNGVSYEVFVNTVITDQNALPQAKVTFNTNNEWGRSNSFPIFRNVFYNVGYLEDDIWYYESQVEADMRFEETFAHEMGHSIVWDYRGVWQSLTHEGSSTLGQDINGDYNYPTTGELDLNKYAGNRKPPDFYERVVANETDVKGLLWVSRLEED